MFRITQKHQVKILLAATIGLFAYCVVLTFVLLGGDHDGVVIAHELRLVSRDGRDLLIIQQSAERGGEIIGYGANGMKAWQLTCHASGAGKSLVFDAHNNPIWTVQSPSEGVPSAVLKNRSGEDVWGAMVHEGGGGKTYVATSTGVPVWDAFATESRGGVTGIANARGKSIWNAFSRPDGAGETGVADATEQVRCSIYADHVYGGLMTIFSSDGGTAMQISAGPDGRGEIVTKGTE